MWANVATWGRRVQLACRPLEFTLWRAKSTGDGLEGPLKRELQLWSGSAARRHAGGAVRQSVTQGTKRSAVGCGKLRGKGTRAVELASPGRIAEELTR